MSSYQAGTSQVINSRFAQNYSTTPLSDRHVTRERVTPRNNSKHRLNDTIEPRIAVDRSNINVPRKSPFKNKFPDPESGIKSAKNSRVGRTINTSLGFGNEPEINSTKNI